MHNHSPLLSPTLTTIVMSPSTVFKSNHFGGRRHICIMLIDRSGECGDEWLNRWSCLTGLMALKPKLPHLVPPLLYETVCRLYMLIALTCFYSLRWPLKELQFGTFSAAHHQHQIYQHNKLLLYRQSCHRSSQASWQ